MTHTRHAFTLIELLVVITIIVVLLALLTPALDKAIYQAELAVCAAGQNGVVKGLNTYASGSRRSYPYRHVAQVKDNVYPWQLNVGSQAGGAVGPGIDDRAPLQGFVDLKMLCDPLCERVDMNDGTAWIYSSYALWWGWTYAGQQGMTKLGNRLNWVDTTANPGKAYSVNWLITDLDALVGGSGSGSDQCSHPDRDGVLRNLVAEKGDHDHPDAAFQAADQTAKITMSIWLNWQQWDRGRIEMNAAAADGSVARFDDVDVFGDERIGYAPVSPNGSMSTGTYARRDGTSVTGPATWINVPIR